MPSRRQFLVLACAASLVPRAALATDTTAAMEHVRTSIGEVVAVVVMDGSRAEKAEGLRRIIETRGSLPDIARFVIGPPWREMDEGQRDRFAAAFGAYVARSYARTFPDFIGDGDAVLETIAVVGATDAGRKGVVVTTEIRPPSLPPVKMDFLVSDRPGRLAIVDLVIEGISMAVTQRELVGAMLGAEGGDVERLIARLESS